MKWNMIFSIQFIPENNAVKEIPKQFRIQAGEHHAQKVMNILLTFILLFVVTFSLWLFLLNRNSSTSTSRYILINKALIGSLLFALVLVAIYKIKKLHGQNSIQSLQRYIDYQMYWRSKIFDSKDFIEEELKKSSKKKHYIQWERLTSEEKKHVLIKGYIHMPEEMRNNRTDLFLDLLLNPDVESKKIQLFITYSGFTTNAFVRTTIKMEELESYKKLLQTT